MSFEQVSTRARRALQSALRHLYMTGTQEREVVEGFRAAYVEARPIASWMGEPTSTPPLDLWIYQEIISEVSPEVIITVGTANSGYLADLCRMADQGQVLAIEGVGGDAPSAAERPRLRVVSESSAIAKLREELSGSGAVLVVLGPGPGSGDLAGQLKRLGALVTVGSYLVIEDTVPGPGLGGPETGERAAAVGRFVEENPSFVVDRDREKLYLTVNGGGYLRRVR